MTFHQCCNNGKIKVKWPHEPPALLKQLLDYQGGPKAKRFRATIRVTNCRFAFTSLGMKIDRNVNVGIGPYTYKASSQNCHRMGSLVPPRGTPPQYAQLYIYDTDNELENRPNVINSTVRPDDLDREIVSDLIAMFDEHNVLVKQFRTARDAYENSTQIPLTLRLVPGGGPGDIQYSDPQVAKTVGLLVGTEDEIAEGLDVIIQFHDAQLHRINSSHSLYMPLQYPIFFPYGEEGYNSNMYEVDALGRTTEVRITMCKYYRYLLQSRHEEWSSLIGGGRLKQQFEVDCWVSTECERLSFCRNQQDTFRTELYSGLVDALNKGDMKADALGRKIILPSSFTGGPRYMDAMSICRNHGNPDYFVTFTCNANWNEIQQALQLYPDQRSEDRSDLSVRVFNLKLDVITRRLKRKFGKCVAVACMLKQVLVSNNLIFL